MKVRLTVLGLLLVFAAPAFAQGDAKAVDIIKKARAVIGKEDKIKGLQNIVAEGTQKVTRGNFNQENQLEITMALPDKIYRATTSQGFGGGGNPTTDVAVLNGSATWTDRIGGGGGGGFGGPGGAGPGGAAGAGGRGGGPGGFMSPELQERTRRNDLARVMIGWLLMAPAGLNAEYTFIGEAKAPDGTADVIGVKTADGIVAKLYIDQQSHRLLMLSYKDKDLRSIMGGGRAPGGQAGGQGAQAGGQRAQGGQAGQGGQGGQAGQGGGQRGPGGLSREEFDKLPQAEKDKLQAEQLARNEARMVEMKAAYEKAPEVDIQWSFTDYKEINGLNLPHVLTKATGGTPTEEWIISKFKFNEKKVTADKFEKKGK